MTARNNPGSSNSVIELQSQAHLTVDKEHALVSGQNGLQLEEHENLTAPATATAALQRWNHPRANIWRVLATFVSFITLGSNDAALGPLIPYLEKYYSLTYTVVSLIFLSPLFGYVFAALINNQIHLRLGQRGVAIIGPSCHLLAYIVVSIHPPYPLLVIVLILAGFGNGLCDAGWNAWIGNMANSNQLLGFLHGFYGLGATLSPLVATTMITKADLPWFKFYYIMVGIALIELLSCATAFWNEDGKKYQDEHPRTTDKKGGRTREALSNKVTLILAAFLLGYVGVEVALGGWIVTFMIRVRSGDPFASGISAVGFWLGVTIGRVVLGFVTPRIGESLAILVWEPLFLARFGNIVNSNVKQIYLGASMGLELLFWLVPEFIVSAIAIAFLGFFLGPLFPAAITGVARLLPKHLHVSAIGFAAAFGGAGAAIFPFAVGAIAQAKGVKVLQPIVLALLATITGLWCLLPRMKKGEECGVKTTVAIKNI